MSIFDNVEPTEKAGRKNEKRAKSYRPASEIPISELSVGMSYKIPFEIYSESSIRRVVTNANKSALEGRYYQCIKHNEISSFEIYHGEYGNFFEPSDKAVKSKSSKFEKTHLKHTDIDSIPVGKSLAISMEDFKEGTIRCYVSKLNKNTTDGSFFRCLKHSEMGYFEIYHGKYEDE